MPRSPPNHPQRSRSQRSKHQPTSSTSSLVPLRSLRASSTSSASPGSDNHTPSNDNTPTPSRTPTSTSQRTDREEKGSGIGYQREIRVRLDREDTDGDRHQEPRKRARARQEDSEDSDGTEFNSGQDGRFLRAEPTQTSQRSHSAASTSRAPLLPRQLILSPSSLPPTSMGSTSHGIGDPYGGKSEVVRTIGKKTSWKLVLSYVSDWVVLAAFAAVAIVLGDIAPIKRPFSLENETISFPFTVHETVPVEYLYATNGAVPILLVAVVALVFVPGPTVPRGTPKRMIWQRRLWELHTGLLGLALAQCAAMFVTNGLKNMFGKPRPDLLSRCQPDMSHVEQYKIGAGLLVTHEICTQTDSKMLDDGFRSWPSGHSSSSAAGLIYLSLFIASKFTITIPFVTPWAGNMAANPQAAVSAFPSRVSTRRTGSDPDEADARISLHSKAVLSLRRQAAAPPLYLFGICLLPFFSAVFIASSRWFDYRHHAFDIFSGFLIGTLAAILGFRYYHMPIAQGAGWAWGPRSEDKAFWAGLGSYSFATGKKEWYIRPGDEEEALEAEGIPVRHNTGVSSSSAKRYGGGSESGNMMTSVPLERDGTTHLSMRAPGSDDEDTDIYPAKKHQVASMAPEEESLSVNSRS